jgi:dolichol-phosphate mannosyltransferase
MKSDAAVVLPTYNEAQTIKPIVSQLLESAAVAEIVVVDDDSPDETWRVVREGFDSSRVTAIRRTDESGLSSAVLRGFDEADADVLAVMDADGQHPVGSTLTLIRAVEGGADLAVGSRRNEQGMVADDWPAHRRVVSWGATALAWTAVPQARGLTDPMSGLFAIRSDAVDAVRDQLRPKGYKILLELLARCPLADIEERGYTFRERAAGGSNLGAGEYVNYVQHLARLSVPSRQHTPQEVPESVAD